MTDRYEGYKTKRYGATYDGHDIELEFDKKLVVLNRARLRSTASWSPRRTSSTATRS